MQQQDICAAANGSRKLSSRLCSIKGRQTVHQVHINKEKHDSIYLAHCPEWSHAYKIVYYVIKC